MNSVKIKEFDWLKRYLDSLIQEQIFILKSIIIFQTTYVINLHLRLEDKLIKPI